MPREAGRCAVWSPCKINPTLEILGRRSDGMHEVHTSMLALDLCDRVLLELCPGDPGLRLTCSGPASSQDIPLNASNLAWRGARVALDAAAAQGLLPPDLGLRMHLEKHVPSQAGLGGGSSNAAAAALGVAQLLGLDPSDGALGRGLGELGADVLFFLAARASGWGLCSGRGERVEPLELPPMDGRVFVLWTPRVTCSTGVVYGALRSSEMHRGVHSLDPDRVLQAPLGEARKACRNDLEAPALRSHPELLRLRDELQEMGPGVAGLSGSGSSFYGMFKSLEHAEDFLRQPAMARISRDFGLRLRCIARPLGRGVSLDSPVM